MNFYSQSNEDKIIYNKYLYKLNTKNGIYLEMGAMDGKLYSNTLFLEENLNWTGILIEPHPNNYNKLQKNRPNNKLFNCVVSDNDTKEIEYLYYETESLSGVSGIKNTLKDENVKTFFSNHNEWMDYQIKNHLKTINIKPRTLTDIIKESGFTKIDFFSLDVEGHELNVLNSFDWSIPINMFLIENNQDTQKINNILLSKKYLIVDIIGPNTFYVLESFYNNYFLSI